MTIEFQTQFAKGEWRAEVAAPSEAWLKAIDKLPAGVQYLVAYGWKQALSDSFAGAKTEAEMQGKINARLDKIVAGKMEISGAIRQQRSALEIEIWHIAEARVMAAAAAKRTKLTKQALAAYAEQYVSRFREELTVEAEANIARMAELAEAGGDFLTELLA